MRDKIRDKDRIKHMSDAIALVLNRFSEYTPQQIQNDPILFFGFVKHLEIMGEAAYMLTHEYKDEHSDINWRVIEGLRHILVHGYYKIRPDEIFNTITKDLPEIKIQIDKLL